MSRAAKAHAHGAAVGHPGAAPRRARRSRAAKLVIAPDDAPQLAGCALRASGVPVALLRGRRITASGPGWGDLERQLAGIDWQPRQHAGEPPAPRPGDPLRGLAALAGHAAARLERTRADEWTGRYDQVGGPRVLRLRAVRWGGRACVGVAAQDVSEQLGMERQLAEARLQLFQQEGLRALGELASGVAHDLNNTLNVMSLRLAMIRRDPACAAAQGRNLDALARIVADAASRIGSLQGFTRQRRERPLEPVDLRRVIHEAIDMVMPELRDAIRGARIRIRADVPPLPAVPGDPTELRHVFVNLLFNARDAMPLGGAIELDARLEGRRVIVRVADEGSGIPADDLERIMEPFFTTKGTSGTGLGLSMAYGAMRRLGGQIEACNRPEKGALFTLTFPLARRTPLATLPEPTTPPRPGQRVLVVDDERENLEVIEAVLRLEGQEVHVAQTGRAAIERLSAGERYDLVLCDIGMPDVDGWQVARAARETCPDTRVYMLTGWAQQLADDDPRRDLVAGVLAKPTSVEDIVRALARRSRG